MGYWVLGLPVMALMLVLQTVSEEANRRPGDNATLIGQSILFLTFLVNIFVQLWRERRDRLWKLQDQKRADEKLQHHEKRMNEKIDSQTEELKASARTRVTDLGNTLDKLLAERENKRDAR